MSSQGNRKVFYMTPQISNVIRRPHKVVMIKLPSKFTFTCRLKSPEEVKEIFPKISKISNFLSPCHHIKRKTRVFQPLFEKKPNSRIQSRSRAKTEAKPMAWEGEGNDVFSSIEVK